jgi:hypothetical protein
MVRDSLKGTNLWRNLMLFSGYVFMFVLMFFLLLDFVVGTLPVLICFGVWIFIAWTIMREAKIGVYRRYGGKKVLVGTLGEEEDMGEMVEFNVKNIVSYVDLTDEEKRAINELISKEEHFLTQLDQKDNVRYALQKKTIEKIENKK